MWLSPDRKWWVGSQSACVSWHCQTQKENGQTGVAVTLQLQGLQWVFSTLHLRARAHSGFWLRVSKGRARSRMCGECNQNGRGRAWRAGGQPLFLGSGGERQFCFATLTFCNQSRKSSCMPLLCHLCPAALGWQRQLFHLAENVA